MEPDDEKLEESNDKKGKEEKVNGNAIFCPLCGSSTYIPDDLLEEQILICPVCNKEFSNPFHSTGIKPVTSAKKTSEVKEKSKNKVIIVVFTIILIIGGVWYFSSGDDSSSDDYKKPYTFNSSVKMYYDHRDGDRDILRQCMKLYEIHNNLAFSAHKKNEDINQKESDIFVFRSDFSQVSVPGLDGATTRNGVVFHTFDLSRMVIIKSMVVNGTEVGNRYPIKSVSLQTISGHTVFKMDIKVSGVEVIGFNPKAGNIWYEYLDGKEIAYLEVKKLK